MTITTKPSCPLEQVQLNIGDTEEELIAATVIQYILDNNGNSVPLATVEATKYIISSLTKRVNEEVGDVKIAWSQLLDNYRKLLKDFVSNPSYQTNGASIYIGGVNQTEIDRVNADTNSVSGGLCIGEFTTPTYSTSSDSDIYL